MNTQTEGQTVGLIQPVTTRNTKTFKVTIYVLSWKSSFEHTQLNFLDTSVAPSKPAATLVKGKVTSHCLIQHSANSESPTTNFQKKWNQLQSSFRKSWKV